MLPTTFRLVTIRPKDGSNCKKLHACIMRNLQEPFGGSRGMAAFVGIIMPSDASETNGNEVVYLVAWDGGLQKELDKFMQALSASATNAARTLRLEIEQIEHKVTPLFLRARLGARQAHGTIITTQYWPCTKPAALQRFADQHEPYATAPTELLFASMRIGDGADEGKILAIAVYGASEGPEGVIEQVQKHWAEHGPAPSLLMRRLVLPTGGLIVFP